MSCYVLSRLISGVSISLAFYCHVRVSLILLMVIYNYMFELAGNSMIYIQVNKNNATLIDSLFVFICIYLLIGYLLISSIR